MPLQVRVGTTSRGAEAEQNVEAISGALEGFLAEHPRAVVLEDGKAIFDMREAKYRLATEHGRCTLHLWSEDRNLRAWNLTTVLRNCQREDRTGTAVERQLHRLAQQRRLLVGSRSRSECAGQWIRQSNGQYAGSRRPGLLNQNRIRACLHERSQIDNAVPGVC